MSEPISPFVSTVGIRQLRKDGNAIQAAMILDLRGDAVTVEHIPATPSQPISSYRVTIEGPTDAEFSALAASVASAITYGVSGGRWEVPVIYEFTIGPVILPAVLGAFYRVDASGAPAAEQFTLQLPLVTAADVGRRIGFAEISGAPVGFGSGGAELYVSTTDGQTIDMNFGTPFDALTGTRPRVIFVAAQMTLGPDTYGWTLEGSP
jgi:hypothetical protein